MADVTDAAFRRVIAKYGKLGRTAGWRGGPDVFWTEFVSADGLMSPGREVLLNSLKYTGAERPILAQLFTSKPEKMEQAARLCAELGFDGVDINMGCPDQSVEKQGAGAALIMSPKLAQELIKSANRGVRDKLPGSVKTPLGYRRDELDTWLPALLEVEPAAVTIHARTRQEMSKVPARWGDVARAVDIRNKLGSSALIIGNGDLRDLADARARVAESGADGAMLGRAIFGNPWLFANPPHQPRITERLRVLVEHTRLFAELLGGIKSFAVMKKHYKAYVTGWEGAKELRLKLMEANSAEEVAGIVEQYLASNTDY